MANNCSFDSFLNWIFQRIVSPNITMTLESRAQLVSVYSGFLKQVNVQEQKKKILTPEKRDQALQLLIEHLRILFERVTEPELVKPIVNALSDINKKDQPFLQHDFVAFADVLIGWATSDLTPHGLRDNILDLISGLQPLWLDNTVFCMRLLSAFPNDIAAMCHENLQMNRHKVDALMVGFICVCKSLPKIGELVENTIENNYPDEMSIIVLSSSNSPQQPASILAKVLTSLVHSSEITLS